MLYFSKVIWYKSGRFLFLKVKKCIYSNGHIISSISQLLPFHPCLLSTVELQCKKASGVRFIFIFLWKETNEMNTVLWLWGRCDGRTEARFQSGLGRIALASSSNTCSGGNSGFTTRSHRQRKKNLLGVLFRNAWVGSRSRSSQSLIRSGWKTRRWLESQSVPSPKCKKKKTSAFSICTQLWTPVSFLYAGTVTSQHKWNAPAPVSQTVWPLTYWKSGGVS